MAVGLPPSSEGVLQFDPFELFRKDSTIIYFGVGTVQDMRELVDLAARGEVRSRISRVGGLDDLGQMLDELAAGTYLGRAVVDFAR